MSEELQALEAQLRSVQRNYDNLSSVLQAKQLEALQLQGLYEVERTGAAELAGRLQQALQRCEQAGKQLQELQGLPAEVQALQQRLEQQRFAESVATTRAATLNASLEQAQQELGRQRQQAAHLRRDLEVAREDRQRALDEVKEQKAANKALQEERRQHAAELGQGQALSQQLERQVAGLLRRCEAAVQRAEEESMRADAAQAEARRLRNCTKEAEASQAAVETALTASQDHQQLLQSQLDSTARMLRMEQDKTHGLQQQADSLKRSEKEARRQVQQTTSSLASQHDEEVTQLQTQLAEARHAAATSQQQVSNTRDQHAAALSSCLSRVDRGLDRLVAVQQQGDQMGQLAMRPAIDLASMTARSGKWLQVLQGLEVQASCMDDVLRTLAMLRKAAHKQYTAHAVDRVSMLEASLAGVEAELAAEQRGHCTTQQQLAQARQLAAAELAATSARLQRENEAERQRLQAKLRLVQEEMAGLRRCWESDKAAAMQLRSAERQQTDDMQRQLSECLVEQSECCAMLGVLEADMAAVLVDVRKATAQLATSGHAEASTEAALPKQPAMAPDEALSQAMQGVHGQFRSVREALQLLFAAKIAHQQAVPPPALSEREQALRATVSKLVHVEEAQEALYTCLACMGIFRHPVTCHPCGHTYCRACLHPDGTFNNMACIECSGANVEACVENRALDGLCSKYEYKLDTLRSLQRLCSC